MTFFGGILLSGDSGTLYYISYKIGAVKLDENLAQLGTFQTFIKPTKNPILSDFCVELTSIKQRDVDNAPYFAEALYDFERWICSDDADSILISWGHYDKKQLLLECDAKNYNGEIVRLLDTHRSLKHDYAKMRGAKPCGMEKALRILNIPLDGTHHRGIDDALNIAKIFRVIFADWKKITEIT